MYNLFACPAMFSVDCDATARLSLTDSSTWMIVASECSVQALTLFRYLGPPQSLCLHQMGPLLELHVQVTFFVRKTEVVHLHIHCRFAISHQSLYENLMMHIKQFLEWKWVSEYTIITVK